MGPDADTTMAVHRATFAELAPRLAQDETRRLEDGILPLPMTMELEAS